MKMKESVWAALSTSCLIIAGQVAMQCMHVLLRPKPASSFLAACKSLEAAVLTQSSWSQTGEAFQLPQLPYLRSLHGTLGA